MKTFNMFLLSLAVIKYFFPVHKHREKSSQSNHISYLVTNIFVDIFKYPNRFRIVFLLMLITGFLITSCKEEPQEWTLKSEEQCAADYIASHPEQYSEFAKLIESTGLEALLNVRGPFTVFLPTNKAMFAYYNQNNGSSLSDFNDVFQKNLIYNHIVTDEISTDDFALGALRDTNALGDYLVTTFRGSEIIINRYSKIIKPNIRTANGYIHVIDQVLTPMTKDIYSVLSSDPSFSIFSAGLSLTGLKDTLQLISFPYGKKTARTRFTLLATPDSIYHRYGINNVEDLIKWCGAKTDSLTSHSNSFYRYIEYHCLNGCYYLSDLKNGIYSILSRDNNLSVTIDTDYKLNLNKKTKKFTGFNVQASNIPAKNGALHVINDLLPVTEPEPSVIIFETTDFFDLKQGDYYGKYYAKWSDGQNTFAKIHWVGDYLQYFIRKDLGAFYVNYDCLQMVGWWSISITFPKVMKGKYSVYVFIPYKWYTSNCIAYIDGALTQYTYYGEESGGRQNLQKIGDVNFTTTAEHTITLRSISYGNLYWDYVLFDPEE